MLPVVTLSASSEQTAQPSAFLSRNSCSSSFLLSVGSYLIHAIPRHTPTPLSYHLCRDVWIRADRRNISGRIRPVGKHGWVCRSVVTLSPPARGLMGPAPSRCLLLGRAMPREDLAGRSRPRRCQRVKLITARDRERFSSCINVTK